MPDTGYAHPGYAASLSFLGMPRQLPRSGAWLLSRAIGTVESADAVACYPLLVCADWAALECDLAEVEGLVSLAAVIDPFGDCSRERLARCFPDLLLRYKQHFVNDLRRPLEATVCAHHRRNVRWSLARVEVERCVEGEHHASNWVRLYGNLVRRHGIDGAAAFPAQTLVRQLGLPGVMAFRASVDGDTVGMLLWVVRKGVAYYHLGAYSDEGYRCRASFALFWTAARYFQASGLRWLSLGAEPDANAGEGSGLFRFKQGWATGTRQAYFGGRIFDHRVYQSLSAHIVAGTRYFPAYRAHD